MRQLSALSMGGALVSRAVKWVYAFSEVEQAEALVDGEWQKVRALLGGRGQRLTE